MSLQPHRPDTWFQVLWTALHGYRENCIPEGEEAYDKEWGDITTAMAWLEESLTSHDQRVTTLMRYNSGQVVQRRVAHAKLRIAEAALKELHRTIGDLKRGFAASVDPVRWVEQVQAHIDKAFNRIQSVNPDDYGRP